MWWIIFISKCVCNCWLLFKSVLVISWTKFRTFNRSMLVWVWSPDAEATWMFFGSGCSFLFSVYLGSCCVSCSFWFCYNNLIWFLKPSISLSLSVDVCFVVEGNLVGNFQRRCCVWARCSNFSFFQESWWFF